MSTLTFVQKYGFGYPLHVVRWLQGMLRDHTSAFYTSMSEDDKCEFEECGEDITAIWDLLPLETRRRFASHDFSNGEVRIIPTNKEAYLRQLDAVFKALNEFALMDEETQNDIMRSHFPNETEIVAGEHRNVTLIKRHSIAGLVFCLNPSNSKTWIQLILGRAQKMQEEEQEPLMVD